MPLIAGTKLGSFEVVAPLGAGGMGEVYRARDSKLGRDVALKVLPEAFAKDEQRMARFQREAQVLASLNHPNIATIHGLEESGATRALVMELVEGPTLAERIARGAILIEEALPIAKQIAEALEYAHERSIVHRDLKPANIKLTKDGQVKVLDFGLAKALSDEAVVQDIATSPTLSMAATQAGIILGTAAYMSPEQAKGKSVDRRGDIWAFGVVFFEMLTGRQMYTGETGSEVLAHVITKDPELSALPQNTPAQVRELLKRCLTKDPKQRLQAIGEARIAIEQAIANPEIAGAISAGTPAPVTPLWQRVAPWGIAAIALGAAAILYLKPAPSPNNQVVRFAVRLPEAAIVENGLRNNVAISPDGQHLAFVLQQSSQQKIYLRAIDSLETTAVTGTEGASNPFFSPDGQSLGFMAEGKLKRIRLGGASPITITDAPDSRGATWAEDDAIIFTSGTTGGLLRISATGGAPKEVTHLQEGKGERSHRWPNALPGGRGVIFTVGTLASTEDYDSCDIDGVLLATGERKKIISGARMAQYFPATGQLLYVHEGDLFAIEFDPERLVTLGKPVHVLQGVAGEKTTGVSHFVVSNTGTLFYMPGSDFAAGRVLGWMDASGKPEPLPVPPQQYFEPMLSPDGQRIAADVTAGNSTDVWIYDIGRKTMNRLTFGPSNFSSIWSADGRRVIYHKEKGDGKTAIVQKAADGTGGEEILYERDRVVFPSSESPDGKWLAITILEKNLASDIYILPMTGDRKPLSFVTGPFDESLATFSPDGRWVMYRSNETGRYEIFVKPFPQGSERWQISTDGGLEARWVPGGKEIVYRFESHYTSVPVETGASFRAGAPKRIINSDLPRINSSSGATFSVSRDGKRVLVAYPPNWYKSTFDLVVAPNWADEVRRATNPKK